ncbi:MAG: dnaK 1, partial [Bacteroidetes bacterium]|nr:dnaK 1 [Bacteroidota bacterium]
LLSDEDEDEDEDEYEEVETIDNVEESVASSEPGKQPLLAKAKALRKRAEKLLGSIAEEDAKDIRDMLEKNREAINTGDMKRLAETNTSLEDIIFYLED